MNQILFDKVEENPVIAAVKNMEGLKECCSLEEIRVVFVLFGDICTVGRIVSEIKKRKNSNDSYRFDQWAKFERDFSRIY